MSIRPSRSEVAHQRGYNAGSEAQARATEAMILQATEDIIALRAQLSVARELLGEWSNDGVPLGWTARRAAFLAQGTT